MLPPPVPVFPSPSFHVHPLTKKEKKVRFRFPYQPTVYREAGESRERETPGVEGEKGGLVPMMRCVVRASEYRESPYPRKPSLEPGYRIGIISRSLSLTRSHSPPCALRARVPSTPPPPAPRPTPKPTTNQSCLIASKHMDDTRKMPTLRLHGPCSCPSSRHRLP